MDWAGEYGDLGLKRRGVEDLSLSGVELSHVVDALEATFALTKPQVNFIYRACLGASSIKELVAKVRGAPLTSASEREIQQAVLRRLEPLERLRFFEGRASVEELIKEGCRVDLSSLPYEARRLASNLLLRMVYNALTTRRVSVERAVVVLKRRGTRWCRAAQSSRPAEAK